MKYLIANWKSTKNIQEAINWVVEFNSLLKKNTQVKNSLDSDDLKIIICPSIHLLSTLKENIFGHKNINIGAQDVSFFEQGNYTGEVSAQNLKDLIEYSIVGHSERRKYLKETDNIIDQKIAILKDYSIEPILCVRDEKDLIPKEARFIAYEPVYAIGTGKNESLKDVLISKAKISPKLNSIFIYGGSVSPENVQEYSNSSEIHGFLVGTASKDPESFIQIASKL
ncbi:MAG: triose-phosphate isomerase family protein [Patescibacteria group bacterium]